MANTVALVAKYQPILDEIYKAASATAVMDSPVKPVPFAGANVVKVMKTEVVGLGDYSRATGYTAGDVQVSWETMTLSKDRQRELFMDRMDDEETFGMAFGTLMGEFMRTQVIPELDAYRFAAYASKGSISTTTAATLSASTVLAAIDAAKLQMAEDQFPTEGLKLFISHTCKSYLDAAVTRMLGNERGVERRLQTLDGIDIIPVPQSRFYTAITLDAGASASAGGFSKSGTDINFLLVHPSAVVQVTKHDNLKIFSPDENQTKDGWKIQYRLYHDAFVYDNKVDGIYLHKKAT